MELTAVVVLLILALVILFGAIKIVPQGREFTVGWWTRPSSASSDTTRR